MRRAAEYVLPLRWTDDAGLAELTAYLTGLAALCDVTVVDGSPPARRAAHARAWAGLAPRVRQLPVGDWPGRNRKVAGVVTGVRAARHERVVVADDDVRYDGATLAAVLDRLVDADLVRPQNVFVPQPWHARWDTGRTLLNRALGVDHPGTFGLRRSTFLRMGGYEGDVLFENLELRRAVRAAGGRERDAADVAVARRPPSTRQFVGQRVRQAYDDLGQPVRLVAEAALLPAAVVAARRALRAPRPLRQLGRDGVGVAAAVVALAEVGRRRRRGRAAFAWWAPLWAPLWLAERAVCVWLALARRPLGGVRYSDGRLRTAAHSERELRRRQVGRSTRARLG